METYSGHVRTPADAIVLFEACRLGHLPRVQRRLSEKERQQIKSGSVFVWDEREAGMRRWTDGKSWSASRVSGSFLTYREMEGKRGGSSFSPQVSQVKRTANGGYKDVTKSSDGDLDMGDDGPDGYRYKPDGLMKQSFSITTSQGQHLHLISYYARSHTSSTTLTQPTNDPLLRHIRPAKGMYPETTLQDGHQMPAVTRSPMIGSPYASSPASMSGHAPAYSRSGNMPHALQGPPSYANYGPPSPMGSPMNVQYYGNGASYRSGASANSSPMYPGQHGMPPHMRLPPGPTAFDRPPTSSTLPPPPPPPPPPQQPPHLQHQHQQHQHQQYQQHQQHQQQQQQHQHHQQQQQQQHQQPYPSYAPQSQSQSQPPLPPPTSYSYPPPHATNSPHAQVPPPNYPPPPLNHHYPSHSSSYPPPAGGPAHQDNSRPFVRPPSPGPAKPESRPPLSPAHLTPTHESPRPLPSPESQKGSETGHQPPSASTIPSIGALINGSPPPPVSREDSSQGTAKKRGFGEDVRALSALNKRFNMF